MSVSVSMPQLGESVTEGTVTRWLKKEGERVEADEPLLEVSTDKVDTEIPSPVSGVLRGITVAEDETVAGATVQLVVAVEPNSENRRLRVEADGDNMFRATEMELEGAKEQRLHTVEFKNLSAGGYTLRAQVMSNSSVRSQAEQEIMVAGDGTSPGGW